MKRIFFVFFVVALLTACGEHAEPGSSLAARFMAAEFVGKMFNVDPVRVDEEPVVSGDTATVKALFLGGGCNLEFVRKSGANRYGWQTRKISCEKAS